LAVVFIAEPRPSAAPQRGGAGAAAVQGGPERKLLETSANNKLPTPGVDQGKTVHWLGTDLQKAHETFEAAVAKNQPLPNPHDFVPLPITHTHAFNLVHYPIPGQQPAVEFHEGNTDVFFVVAGGATITLGGSIQDKAPIPGKPGEYRGSKIVLGRDYKLKPGDVMNIPPSTPEMIVAEPGGFTAMVVKVNVGRFPYSQIVAATQQPRAPTVIHPDIEQGPVYYWAGEDLRKVHARFLAEDARNTNDRDLVGELPITPTHFFTMLHRPPHDHPRASEIIKLVEYHEGVTDVYLIVGGSTTLVIGGEIEGPIPVPNQMGEWRGKSIKGGQTYKLKAGDILTIPPTIPHHTFADPGGFTYMLLKINVNMYPWAFTTTQQ
jgi:mannose-6-phosphate isomerase-like protein (cupin superfamily)